MDKEQKEKMKQEEANNKRVAYYSSWLNTWIDNRMEVDKRLLTFSSLAIGLLLGVFGESATTFGFYIWLAAGLMFLFCAILILSNFYQNAVFIEILLAEHKAEDEKNDKKQKELSKKMQAKLDILKWISMTSAGLFLLGVILTITIAIMKSRYNF